MAQLQVILVEAKQGPLPTDVDVTLRGRNINNVDKSLSSFEVLKDKSFGNNIFAKIAFAYAVFSALS